MVYLGIDATCKWTWKHSFGTTVIVKVEWLIAEHALSNISVYIFKLKRGQAVKHWQ